MNAPSYETRRKERLAAIQKQRQELEQMELRFKSKHQTWLRYVARVPFIPSTSAPHAALCSPAVGWASPAVATWLVLCV